LFCELHPTQFLCELLNDFFVKLTWSEMLAALKTVPAIAQLDEPLLDYLVSVCEDEARIITSEKALYDKIGEHLLNYEAAADEKAAMGLCELAFATMSSQGLVTPKKDTKANNPKPDPKPISNPKAEAKPVSKGAQADPKPKKAQEGKKDEKLVETPVTIHVPATDRTNLESAFRACIPFHLTISSDVVSHLTSQCEGVRSADELNEAIGELLVAHDLAAEESAALELCQKLFASMKITTSSSAKPPPTPALEDDLDVRANDSCEARYRQDGAWYPATILRVIDDDAFEVEYADYGNSEILTRAEIRNVIKKFRQAAICINDAIREDEEAKKRELERRRKANEKTMTAAELKRSRKAQKKIEVREQEILQKRAEQVRLKRYNALKHREAVKAALPIHLEAIARLRQQTQGAQYSRDVRIPDVQLLSPDNTELLQGSELKLVAGKRYGLIGRNGVGKTTLLRQISTYQIPSFPTFLKVLHVEQEIHVGDDMTALETVMSADVERNMLREEEKELLAVTAKETKGTSTKKTKAAEHAADRLTEIYDRLNEIGAWDAQGRASQILSGLQFSTERQQQKTKDLSGGWRMRVMLASALFVNPDVLLLDEPTNHLDFPTVLWLQTYLTTQFTKTLIVVSHDRTFLNEVCTDIAFFTNNKSLEYYPGNYDDFTKLRQQKYIAAKRLYDAQQMRIQHLEEYIKTYYTAKKSAAQDNMIGQVESKKKILEKMERLPDPDIEMVTGVVIRFPDPGPLRVPLLVDVRDLYFRYEFSAKSVSQQSEEKFTENRPWLLQNVSVRVEKESRIGCLGANGSGKSTLIKVILNELKPVKGMVTNNSTMRTALFAQHHVDSLNLSFTALEQLQELYPGSKETDCR